MTIIFHDNSWTAANSNDNWGLARITSRRNPWTGNGNTMFAAPTLPGTADFSPTLTGSGVDVYVLDSGVQIDHPGFTGVDSRVNVINIGLLPTEDDAEGHGSFVAGVIASTPYGVARGARIISLRVSSSNNATNGTTVGSALVAVMSHYAVNSNPACINISLGVSEAGLLSQGQINSLNAAGLPIIASAGNDFVDVQSDTTNKPAAYSGVLVVGGLQINDTIMHNPLGRSGTVLQEFGSNYGADVDLWAPGGTMVSCNRFTTATSLSWQQSGTSNSAPIVSGVAACMLQGRTKFTSAAEVTAFYNEILGSATTRYAHLPFPSTVDKVVYLDPSSSL